MSSTDRLRALAAALKSTWAPACLGLMLCLGPLGASAETTTTAQPSDEQPSEGEALAARQFRMLDFNGDGYLSRGEVALFPKLAKAFDAADANHDGKVSFEEIRAYAREVRAQKEKAEASSKADTGAAKP
ncbi:EF-hand domain-containing protein [Curvibacter lanceolatus]|uniref:EF-hand domain-containing protein n=1 Tax=Curvibacter lanceolatus TaxID=86182 RepID=UPI001FE1A968|nr:EF-hand domain-containing protein [Curvibacter lanceolatus]